MVNGLSIFKEHFREFTNQYVLIGGTACEWNLNQLDLAYRATKDLDIVLSLESSDAMFIRHLWNFINQGQYERRETAMGKKQVYRFTNPQTPDYPFMLELFSRALIEEASNQTLTPIPTTDELSSLSAIVLNDDYYTFIQQERKVIEGLSVLSPEGLIVLKAKAWIDLSNRKLSGESVDQRDINKHKNDIFRLVQVIVPKPISLGEELKQDMQLFMNRISEETIDSKNLRIPLSDAEIKNALKTLLNG